MDTILSTNHTVIAYKKTGIGTPLVMHNILGGIVALTTIIMPLLMGLGLRQKDGFSGYANYAFITSAIIFLSGLTGVMLAGQGIQLFGLFERITIGSYEIWIFVTALRLLKTKAFE